MDDLLIPSVVNFEDNILIGVLAKSRDLANDTSGDYILVQLPDTVVDDRPVQHWSFISGDLDVSDFDLVFSDSFVVNFDSDGLYQVVTYDSVSVSVDSDVFYYSSILDDGAPALIEQREDGVQYATLILLSVFFFFIVYDRVLRSVFVKS